MFQGAHTLPSVEKQAKRTYRKFDRENDELNFEFTYNPDETAALHRQLNRKADIDMNDLRRISLWKLDRVMLVSDETLSKLQELASAQNLMVTDDLAHDTIKGLVGSDGIGYPMASAILKFLRPDVFPIIDVRAYRALTGKKPYYGTYTYEKYCEYTTELQAIADAEHRPLREIDEQLYCFDDHHNGSI